MTFYAKDWSNQGCPDWNGVTAIIVHAIHRADLAKQRGDFKLYRQFQKFIFQMQKYRRSLSNDKDT